MSATDKKLEELARETVHAIVYGQIKLEESLNMVILSALQEAQKMEYKKLEPWLKQSFIHGRRQNDN